MKSRFDKARWETLSPLIDELLALDAPARAKRIAELRREGRAEADDLAGLLRQYDEMEQEGFLEHPVVRPVQEPGLQGQVVGSYTLDSLLGQGGMGTVWLAHRSDGRYDARASRKIEALGLRSAAVTEPASPIRERTQRFALPRLVAPEQSGVLGFRTSGAYPELPRKLVGRA